MALTDYDYAQKVKPFRSDGIPGADVVPGTFSSTTTAAGSMGSTTPGANTVSFAFSATEACRVRLDGTTPTATVGLYVPANTIAVFPCRPGASSSIRWYNTGAATATVSLQYYDAV